MMWLPPRFNINCLHRVFFVCVQDHGVFSLNWLAKCACFAACCGSAWPSTMCQWRHSMDTSILVMGPRIWTFPSCYKKRHYTNFKLQIPRSSVVHLNPQNVFYATYCRSFCLSYLKTNKLKRYSRAVCVYKLFVPFSSHAQKLFLYSKHMLRAFYLHICVALSIQSQHTTYFETVTWTQLMLTLSCQLVHFKGFFKTNRDRIDGSGWGWAWFIKSVTQLNKQRIEE